MADKNVVEMEKQIIKERGHEVNEVVVEDGIAKLYVKTDKPYKVMGGVVYNSGEMEIYFPKVQ
jgi:hypothetical protein